MPSNAIECRQAVVLAIDQLLRDVDAAMQLLVVDKVEALRTQRRVRLAARERVRKRERVRQVSSGALWHASLWHSLLSTCELP